MPAWPTYYIRLPASQTCDALTFLSELDLTSMQHLWWITDRAKLCRGRIVQVHIAKYAQGVFILLQKS